MTAKKRLKLAIWTFTQLRNMAIQNKESGLSWIDWDTALMLLTRESALMGTARICGWEESKK